MATTLKPDLLKPGIAAKAQDKPKPVEGRQIDVHVSYFKQPLSARQKVAIRTGGHSAHGLADGTAFEKLTTTVARAISHAHELGETEIRIRLTSRYCADIAQLK